MVAAAGGIDKWKLAAGKWTKSTTISLGNGGGARGVAGYVTGTAITLFATGDSTSGAAAYKVTDSVSGTPAPVVTPFATPSQSHASFRGVAFYPVAP